MKKYLSLILIVITSFTFYDGCVPSQQEEEVEILPAERLVKKLEANRRKIKNFEGRGTISVKTPNFNNSATFRVLFHRPDSISLSIFGPFNIELAQAMITKRSFQFYDALSNTVYKGDAGETLLKDMFRVNLSFSDLNDAFLGAVNLSENLYTQPDEYSIEYSRYLLTYADKINKTKKQFRVDIKDLGIVSFALLDETGAALLKGEYSDFSIIESIAIPRTINLSNEKDKQYVSISYQSIKINSQNSMIDFSFPEDADVIEY